MNLPNYLTVMRIALIPVFVLFFYIPFDWGDLAAGFIFFIACVTDALDGYLARSWEQTSKLGAFLDPVADKLIVSTALVLLVGERNIPFIAIPAAIIVGRELIISALREWMAEMGQRTSIAVSVMGKVKTIIQMFALGLLIAFRPENSWLGIVGYLLLYVAALLTMWSMVIYLKVAWPDLIENK